jgi:acetyltransferase-like isoleucine patch superfamily enzyme
MNINAEHVEIGVGVSIGDNVTFSGKHGKRAERVILGDHVKILDNVTFALPSVEIGDYTLISEHCEISGYKECVIGSCSWFGRNSILNSHGGLYIGNGVGVGAYSQLWTHIRFGDTLQGCRFDSVKEMVIEDDVWFVGRCLVSPIHAGKKSMAMAGSVVTGDMEENHIYAGIPAKDITDKLGNQYEEPTIEEKYNTLMEEYERFLAESPAMADTIYIAREWEPWMNLTNDTIFNVSDRTYTKRNTPEEIAFMKHLLMPIKFYPKNDY